MINRDCAELTRGCCGETSSLSGDTDNCVAVLLFSGGEGVWTGGGRGAAVMVWSGLHVEVYPTAF